MQSAGSQVYPGVLVSRSPKYLLLVELCWDLPRPRDILHICMGGTVCRSLMALLPLDLL